MTHHCLPLPCAHAMRVHISVPDDRIKVAVRDGFVTVDGKVDWRFQRDAVESCLRSISGVRAVTNNIEVTLKVSASEVKTKIEEARTYGCGALPVVDANGKVLGILTDRDICMAIGARNRRPSELRAAKSRLADPQMTSTMRSKSCGRGKYDAFPWLATKENWEVSSV